MLASEKPTHCFSLLHQNPSHNITVYLINPRDILPYFHVLSSPSSVSSRSSVSSDRMLSSSSRCLAACIDPLPLLLSHEDEVSHTKKYYSMYCSISLSVIMHPLIDIHIQPCIHNTSNVGLLGLTLVRVRLTQNEGRSLSVIVELGHHVGCSLNKHTIRSQSLVTLNLINSVSTNS